jgi:hypothetical protein
MEFNENIAKDGRPMYGLSCRTHGRHTEWYFNRASALVAPVIGRRVPHSTPIDDVPTEPVVAVIPEAKGRRAKGQPARNGKEVVEDAMADLVERSGEKDAI